MSIIDRIWAFILQFFHAGEAAVVKGFQAGINNVITQIGPDGWKIIQDAVAAAEAAGGSGPIKFSAAWAKIAEDFNTIGIDLVVNTVKLAVEAAVAELRSQLDSIPNTPTPSEK